MPHASAARATPKRIGETGQALTKIAVTFGVKPRKCPPHGLMLSQEQGRLPKQGRQMLATIDAVDEAAKPVLQLGPTRFEDRLGRMRSQYRKRSIDALTRRDCVSECETRGYQPDHFSIPWIAVSMKEIYGITTPRERCIAFSE